LGHSNAASKPFARFRDGTCFWPKWRRDLQCQVTPWLTNHRTVRMRWSLSCGSIISTAFLSPLLLDLGISLGETRTSEVHFQQRAAEFLRCRWTPPLSVHFFLACDLVFQRMTRYLAGGGP
jgi:hypothetical protein